MYVMPFSRMNSLLDAIGGTDKDFYDGEDKYTACRTDILEVGDSFVMESELPGFKKSEIAIDLDGTTLTIKAVHGAQEQTEGRYIRRERSRRAYQRSFDISGIDTEKISAKYTDGILILTLPKKKAEVPASRKLDIL